MHYNHKMSCPIEFRVTLIVTYAIKLYNPFIGVLKIYLYQFKI